MAGIPPTQSMPQIAPGTVQQTGSGANSSVASTPPNYNLTPSTIQSQFPNGIPQVNPGQITGIPSVYGQMGGSNAYSPQTAISATQAYLQPQFQQQNNALQAALANAGIVGGTTGKATADLGSQQQTTMQNALQPFLLQEQQLKQGALTGDQSAWMTGAGENLNSANQGNQYNTTNLLNAASSDSASYNAMQEYLAGLQSGNWQSQLGSQTSLTETGMTGANAAYQPVYQQPSSPNLGGISSAFSMPSTTAAPGAGGGSNNYYGGSNLGSSLINP